MSRLFKVGIGLLVCASVYAISTDSPKVLGGAFLLTSALFIVFLKRTDKTAKVPSQLSASPVSGSTAGQVRPQPQIGAVKPTIDTIITKYVQRVGEDRGRYRSHEIDDLTCKCVREIISIEPSLGPPPNAGEYLWKWEQRVPSLAAKNLAIEIKRRMHAQEQQLYEQQRARDAAQGQELLDKYKDLVNKFLEIAERKISLLDDYGDERLCLLPKEVDACVVKIAVREGMSEATVKRDLKEGHVRALGAPMYLVHSRLPQLFAEYHEQQKHRVRPKDEVHLLSGTEFETHVARILQQNEWQVSGTPATGDQGADLIASKGGRKVVIQAKRYTGPVGNHAVQEVVGALRFYNGTEGCVVTNSIFTPSARALAQKNNVRLIDGAHLENLNAL